MEPTFCCNCRFSHYRGLGIPPTCDVEPMIDIINYVTGERTTTLPKCRDFNADGKCEWFESKWQWVCYEELQSERANAHPS